MKSPAKQVVTAALSASRGSPRRKLSPTFSTSSVISISSSCSATSGLDAYYDARDMGTVLDMDTDAVSYLRKSVYAMSLGDHPSLPMNSEPLIRKPKSQDKPKADRHGTRLCPIFVEDFCIGDDAGKLNGPFSAEQIIPLHPFFQNAKEVPSVRAPSAPPIDPTKQPSRKLNAIAAQPRPHPVPSRKLHTISAQPRPKVPALSTRRKWRTQAANLATTSCPSREQYYSYRVAKPVPTRVYIRNSDEANELVQMLRGPLGFDMEWVVSFNVGHRERRTALLQLADDSFILLIQVSSMKIFPYRVKKLLEDASVAKMGVNIRNDARKLFKDYGIITRNLVELSYLARAVDEDLENNRRLIALAKLVQRYTDTILDKGPARLSNWEAVLTEDQLEYASNDVHSSMHVGRHLLRMAVVTQHMSPEIYTTDYSPLESSVKENAASPTPISKPSLAETRVREAHLAAIKDAKKLGSDIQGGDAMKFSRPARSVALTPETRAYILWHTSDMSVHDLCEALSKDDRTLNPDTVVENVVRALIANPLLPFSADRMARLLEHGPTLSKASSKWLLQYARDVVESLGAS